jgi:predicted anti-sigma-YlaC factor YlaD
MNCPESLDWLQEHLDGRTPSDRAALDQHLAGCPECRERHAAADRLIEGFSRLPAGLPPAGLNERIARKVLAERRSIIRRRRLWTAAAVAAGLLLTVMAGYQGYRSGWFAPGPVRTQATERDKGKRPIVADRKEAPGTPSLGQTLEEAGITALALTRRTAGETLAEARRWWPAGSIGLPPSPLASGETLAPILAPPAQSLRSAGQNVAAGLRPVTASARRAVDLFLKQIPPLDSDS